MRRFSCITNAGRRQCLVFNSARTFIEHDTDPSRWRNPENAEVRRRHKGVPLGSHTVKEETMRVQQEALLAQRGDDMHWKAVHYIATGITLFLIFLQVIPEYVEPVPSPEYVPYQSE